MRKRYNRKSIRLKGYDYSQSGLYFVTICCQNRTHYFGYIQHQRMHLNDAGIMVSDEWEQIPNRFSNTKLHEFVVMPNHFHAIIEIVGTPVGATLVVAQNTDTVAQNTNTIPKNANTNVSSDDGDSSDVGTNANHGQPQGIAPTSKTLGDVVGAFQSITTVEYIRGVKNYGWKRFDKKLWQRNYWEHIIRKESSYHRIANYINNNPSNWKDDKFHEPK